MSKQISLPLAHMEAHVLLRAIASHNACESTSMLDSQCGTWLAARILRLISPEVGGEQPLVKQEAPKA